MNADSMSSFAAGIMRQKYAHDLGGGKKESWSQIAERVPRHVLGAVNASSDLVSRTRAAIERREFMPGGRYLAATGRALHQTQNCVLNKAHDSREGWADHLYKAAMALMTGAGLGVVYSDLRAEGTPIRKTGGTASGPLALMNITNEGSRGFRQGGDRRGAIWAGLHWWHADVFKFIGMKNWSEEVRALKAKDFNFPAPMDGTNISVILDTKFFAAHEDVSHPLHTHARQVYDLVVRQMFSTAEPGFSIDCGENESENLRNAPVCAGTLVLTKTGYRDVSELADRPASIWTGLRWADGVVFKRTSDAAPITRVSFTGGRQIRCDDSHPFLVERYTGLGARRKLVSVDRVAAKDLTEGDTLHVALPETSFSGPADVESYALGFVYGDGHFAAKSADVSFCAQEKLVCAELMRSDPGVSSVNEKDGRGYLRMYFKSDEDRWSGRNKDVFPIELYSADVRKARSFLAGLFDSDGNWEPEQKRIRLGSKHEGFLRGVARLLEQLGILAGVSKSGHSTYGKSQSYQLVVMGDYGATFSALIPTLRLRPNFSGYKAYRRSTIKVQAVKSDGVEAVYCADVKVEEHSFQAEGVIISNCTEITSADDSDICNLASINMARVRSVEHFKELMHIALPFMIAGTVYSDVPYPKIDQVRTKNRRLGLGLMGLHEWLLKRGKQYGPDSELQKYLEVYATSTEIAAKYAREWGLSEPIKTRAIAPNGTIGIVAETTTGIEPIFCVAYKRRYLVGDDWKFEYVIDPCAKRLIESGVSPDKIEDAYSIDLERRLGFQAWVQQYVDHAISSTINLPAWGSDKNNESTLPEYSRVLMKYLPKLRGVTCYPDGSRGGQPLTPVSYETATQYEGEVFFEQADICDISRTGACG